MRRFLLQLSDLAILLAVVVLLFTVGRAVLYFNFQNYFDDYSQSQIINALLSGFEYDVKVVLIINCLFVFLFLVPIRIYNSAFYISLLKFVYFTINSIALLLNLFDISSFHLNGHRMIFRTISGDAERILADFGRFKIDELIEGYLILLIVFVVFVFILRSLLDFIRQRNFESNAVKKLSLSLSFIILAIYGWFSFNFIEDKENWLDKLYTKADRKIAPLVMNNPYLILSSALVYEYETEDSWDFVEFQAIKNYDSLSGSPVKHISLFFISTDDSSVLAGKSLTDRHDQIREFTFYVLNSGYNSEFRYLDEALLSFPSVLPTVFNQSVYSFNDFESLPEILSSRSFKSCLFSVGYSEKQMKRIKNFHGFDRYSLLDSIADDEDLLVEELKRRSMPDSLYKSFNVMILRGLPKNAISQFMINYLYRVKNDELIFVYYIPADAHNTTPELTKAMKLYLPGGKDSIIGSIGQCLDWKPTILNYLNYSKPYIAYGTSLFSSGNNIIFNSNGNNSYILLKDSLLLNYSDNETKSLHIVRNKKLSKEDFKDSLAVEKIDLENKLHSILSDYRYRFRYNELK